MQNNPPTTALRLCRTIKISSRLIFVYDLYADDSDGMLNRILGHQIVNGQNMIAWGCPEDGLFLKYPVVSDKPNAPTNHERQVPDFLSGKHSSTNNAKHRLHSAQPSGCRLRGPSLCDSKFQTRPNSEGKGGQCPPTPHYTGRNGRGHEACAFSD